MYFLQIFQMLDENAALIKTISEYQNVGKHSETVQYQWSLHRNLMYLASIADSNQNLQNLLPVIFFIFFTDICLTTYKPNRNEVLEISQNYS